MCGHFTLTLEISDLQQEFALSEVPATWQPRYNIAPSQSIAIIKQEKQPRIEWAKWGLIPSWAKDPNIGNQLINARVETLSEKPSFRQSFSQRRCLILADGFFEWKRANNKTRQSIPYYFRLINKSPFAFAGLWDKWRAGTAEEILSCTIITCSANNLVSHIHDRMPVILKGETLWQWLRYDSLPQMQKLLIPYPTEAMTSYSVSRIVNNPSIETPDCILPEINSANLL